MYLPDNSFLQGGKYRIRRFISSGGFGCTYEAEHVMLEERVAIKEFFVKDFCNRDEVTSHVTVGTLSKKGLVEKMRHKFIDEAKALRKLHHPSIVSVSDVFEENGTAYFVMDYVEGRSLREIVDQEGPLTEERAVRYIRQVAKALQHVHDNNRLHLDIKPGNIMINLEDRPVLIDFGASKQYDELDGENTSTLMGKTPGYAPPEQMSNSVVKFSPAIDIYSLGATLYKLLTGITPLDVNLRISGEELAPLPASISVITRNTVSTAMEINKNKRPQSLAEFLSLLDTTLVSKGAKDETTIIEVKEKTEGATGTPNVEPMVPLTKPTERQTPKPEPSVKVLPPEKPSFQWGIFVIIPFISVALLIGLLIFWLISTTPFSQSDSHSPSNTNAQTSSIPVESISLNHTELKLKVGDALFLSVSYTPSHASDKTTMWKSSNPNVAQVDSYGKVMAISPGMATISANCNGKTVYCAVTVLANQVSTSSSTQSSQPIKETDTKQSSQPAKGNTSSGSPSSTSSNTSGKSISISKSELTLQIGQTHMLYAYNYGNSLSWESENTKVATVSATGKVTAVGPGKTSIWVKGESSARARCYITVTKIPEKAMSISESELTLQVGQTHMLSAYNYGNSLSWESDNPKVATVSATGKVTAVGPGQTNIWAKGYSINRCLIIVTRSGSVTSYPSNNTPTNGQTRNIYLKRGEVVQLSIPGQSVTKWESDNPKVATISSTGLVKGIRVGETNVWGYVGFSPTRFLIHVQ